MAPEGRERAAFNAERLLFPLHSNKRPDRLRSPSGQHIADQLLDLADLFTALHPKFWRVVGSYPFKSEMLPACYPAFEGKVDLSVVMKTDPHQSEWSFVRAEQSDIITQRSPSKTNICPLSRLHISKIDYMS